MSRKAIVLLTLTACSIVVAGTAALSAARMQPGLWRNSTVMDMSAMPQLTPQEMAQMRAMGVQIPQSGKPIVNEICVTAAQAAMDTPPILVRDQTGCSPQNTKTTGNQVSTDIVCTGKIKGQGHMDITYSGMTHYQGTYRFQGAAEGQPQNINMTFESNFVATGCGGVKPLP